MVLKKAVRDMKKYACNAKRNHTSEFISNLTIYRFSGSFHNYNKNLSAVFCFISLL